MTTPRPDVPGASLQRTETVFPWQGPSLRFGTGATREVGYELRALGVRRALIVTDSNLVATGLPEDIRGYAKEAGVELEVWAGSRTEPTDQSIRQAMEELRGETFDGYIGLGGGSSIDTCKLVNLLKTHPAELTAYLSKPHGEGRAVPGPLAPMIGIPTTSGTGSECTAMAIVDLHETHTKAAVSHHAMRPRLAIVDPLNAVTSPPAVTASAGYDAVVQALESYTSKPYDQRPAAGSPQERPVYVGFNPISKLWCEEAITQAGRYLQRAVFNGYDIEARTGMALAALFSRLGNAGVHVPHANAYAVAGLVRDYRPAGFEVNHPLVPHGQSVIATAAEAFAFTYPAAPDRHLRAAELLGVPLEERMDDPQQAVTNWLRRLVATTGGPQTLDHFGYNRADVPALVAKAQTQQRVLVCSPRTVEAEDLAAVFERSFAPVK